VDAFDSLCERTVYEGSVGVHGADGGEDRFLELSCWEAVRRASGLAVPLPGEAAVVLVSVVTAWAAAPT
jgi:hypothetical protein